MKPREVKSILLVEDDPDDQELFELALNEVSANIGLIKAVDGFDALQKLNEDGDRPDLIVLDINMPRMNGRDFLIAVKNEMRLKDIPVVIYSTTSESSYIDEIIAFGARSFFKKPDDFGTLCSKIRAITA